IGAHRYWKSRMPQWWFEPAAVLLVFSLVATTAAFLVRFGLSRPALERYVHTTLRRGVVQEQKRVQVGLFRVRETQIVSADCVRLITSSCMLNDCGVAFRPKFEPPTIERDAYQPIGGGWWTWERNW
ncbi:MAG TPA: hypothetical protein VJU79_09070, partial [Candidatus Dormibacteraeota bacterium]|nr:hypothetical protein [Candidatus Dormibacteraeota bacterium]